jgi:hypothetical protein
MAAWVSITEVRPVAVDDKLQPLVKYKRGRRRVPISSSLSSELSSVDAGSSAKQSPGAGARTLESRGKIAQSDRSVGKRLVPTNGVGDATETKAGTSA